MIEDQDPSEAESLPINTVSPSRARRQCKASHFSDRTKMPDECPSCKARMTSRRATSAPEPYERREYACGGSAEWSEK